MEELDLKDFAAAKRDKQLTRGFDGFLDSRGSCRDDLITLQ